MMITRPGKRAHRDVDVDVDVDGDDGDDVDGHVDADADDVGDDVHGEHNESSQGKKEQPHSPLPPRFGSPRTAAGITSS